MSHDARHQVTAVGTPSGHPYRSGQTLGGGKTNGVDGTPPILPLRCPAYAQLSPRRQVPASMAFATDSNRSQPLWRPPRTAYPTAYGATSEVPSLLMHPWGPPKTGDVQSLSTDLDCATAIPPSNGAC